MARPHWDICYAPEGVDPDKTRYLRIHAPPAYMAGSSSATVVIIHGGYWKNQFGLDDAYHNAGVGTLAPFFVSCGMSAVELEYRRRDHEGGGWPGTNQDVLLAFRRLAELKAKVDGRKCDTEGLDMENCKDCALAINALRLDNLIVLGHSAGGCLALWAGHQLALMTNPPCRIAFVVAAAPVADLMKGHEMRVSDEGNAVELYMKCTPDSEVRMLAYQQASPSALLPLRVPVLVVYGDQDSDVPPELIASYVTCAEGSTPQLISKVVVAGANHFDVVNAESEAWKSSILPSVGDMVSKYIGGADFDHFSARVHQKMEGVFADVPDVAMGA